MMQLMSRTDLEYTNVVNVCREIFSKKTKDYGTAWRILRPSSLTDQIFIKAQRIRTVQETGENKVGEALEDEFRAIVNYCIMALIQLRELDLKEMELSPEQANSLYDKYAREAFDLMMKKNHDYGEAWRDMRVSSLTDLILMKILRVKQIEDNSGKTLISEGIDANYFDMLNYAVFALIHLTENEE
jgi:NTP pyrophosphatase (non-canonical NTP hydrolase)